MYRILQYAEEFDDLSMCKYNIYIFSLAKYEKNTYIFLKDYFDL